VRSEWQHPYFGVRTILRCLQILFRRSPREVRKFLGFVTPKFTFSLKMRPRVGGRERSPASHTSKTSALTPTTDAVRSVPASSAYGAKCSRPPRVHSRPVYMHSRATAHVMQAVRCATFGRSRLSCSCAAATTCQCRRCGIRYCSERCRVTDQPRHQAACGDFLCAVCAGHVVGVSRVSRSVRGTAWTLACRVGVPGGTGPVRVCVEGLHAQLTYELGDVW
jgi:hypothetical protein